MRSLPLSTQEKSLSLLQTYIDGSNEKENTDKQLDPVDHSRGIWKVDDRWNKHKGKLKVKELFGLVVNNSSTFEYKS